MNPARLVFGELQPIAKTLRLLGGVVKANAKPRLRGHRSLEKT
jgi:hypothetical protein